VIKLPKKIKICGFDIKVIFPYRFIDVDYEGCFGKYENIIKIEGKDRAENIIIPEREVLATLMHEIVHAIDYTYCDGHLSNYDNYEDDIDRLAVGMSQILFENDLYLRNRQLSIPPRLNIIGFNVKVTFPYDFKEGSLQSSFNTALSEIRIAKRKYDDIFSPPYLKYLLIHNLVAAVSSYLRLPHRDNNNGVLKSLGIAFHQVIMDNKLDILYRRVGKKL